MALFLTTTNPEVLNSSYYKKIESALNDLGRLNTFNALFGNCIAVSNTIYTILKQIGIDSEIVEVEGVISHPKDDGTVDRTFIGFDTGIGKNMGMMIDTHVIVVTKTEIPLIIDASISKLLKTNEQVVLDTVNQDGDIIGNHSYYDNRVQVIYHIKKSQKVGKAHFMSFVDRVNTDGKIFTSLKSLKWLIIMAMILGMTNASRGIYDFYQTYHVNGNNWGSSAFIHLNDRLDKIESILDKQNKK